MAYPENANDIHPSYEAKESSGSVLDSLAKARDISDLELLRVASVQTGHAAYQWNILTDTVTWSENAAQVLGLADAHVPTTGKAFRDLISPEARDLRDDLLLDNTQLDDGNGIEFGTCYGIVVPGDSATFVGIEERGRIHSGQDGTVTEVVAFVRRRCGQQAENGADGNTDEETDLFSKRGIVNQLTKLLDRNEQQTCGLLVATISNMSNISSTYGPVVVPDVVRAVAARLRSVMRGVDILGRTAPNQFAILLCECSSAQIQIAGERFIAAIRDNVIETPHGPVWVELCAGGIVLPLSTGDAAEAFSLAEEASIQAEVGAGDCYLTYTPSPDRSQTHEANRHSAREIIEALNTERFTLWHQPIVDSATRETAMYESLLRMQTPEGEIMSAGHLVPIAEKLGFMHMIDAMVCRTSIQLVAEREDAIVSFNISEGSLNNSYAATRIQSLIAEAGHLASRLCVELSFGSVEALSENAVKLLQELRTLGCSVALSGYFKKGIGLDVLKLVDLVKLDGSVCAGISARPADIGLLKAAVEYARRAGSRVVAEHIETEADAAVLAEVGVDLMQGYLFGEASPEYFNLILSKLGEPLDAIEVAAGTQPAPVGGDIQSPAIATEPVEEPNQDTRDRDGLDQQLMPMAKPEWNTPKGRTVENPAETADAGGPEAPEAVVDLLRSALGKLDAI
jgi:EAL domain-containing protein (putative c-di-GMP-specific phosphodiesterase class I)/GGDEF domain-containing protein